MRGAGTTPVAGHRGVGGTGRGWPGGCGRGVVAPQARGHSRAGGNLRLQGAAGGTGIPAFAGMTPRGWREVGTSGGIRTRGASGSISGWAPASAGVTAWVGREGGGSRDDAGGVGTGAWGTGGDPAPCGRGVVAPQARGHSRAGGNLRLQGAAGGTGIPAFAGMTPWGWREFENSGDPGGIRTHARVVASRDGPRPSPG